MTLPAYPSPGAFAGSPPAPPTQIEVLIENVERRNRLTTAFRLLLAIPQLIAFYALAFVAFFAVIYGWFAALVLGRLPRFPSAFLTNVLRYEARVLAYLFLLTDRYPPWTFKPVEYPVDMRFAQDRLSRWAVLFRLPLFLAAYFMNSFLAFGGAICAPVIWLIAVVIGRVPQPAYQAAAVIMRYELRCTAYLSLLTGTYPWGWFGDPAPRPAPGLYPPPPAPEPEPSPWPDPPALRPETSSPAAPEPEAEPVAEAAPDTLASGQPPGGAITEPVAEEPAPQAWPGPGGAGAWPAAGLGGEPGDPAASGTAGWEVPAPPWPPPPAGGGSGASGLGTWSTGGPALLSWVLTRGARVLLIVIVVLGVLGFIGQDAVNARLNFGGFTGIQRAIARGELDAANSTLSTASNTYQTAVHRCEALTSSKAGLRCQQKADAALAVAFETFSTAVSAIDVPSDSVVARDTLVASAARFASDLTQLAGARGPLRYLRLQANLRPDLTGAAVARDYATLVAVLGG